MQFRVLTLLAAASALALTACAQPDGSAPATNYVETHKGLTPEQDDWLEGSRAAIRYQ